MWTDSSVWDRCWHVSKSHGHPSVGLNLWQVGLRDPGFCCNANGSLNQLTLKKHILFFTFMRQIFLGLKWSLRQNKHVAWKVCTSLFNFIPLSLSSIWGILWCIPLFVSFCGSVHSLSQLWFALIGPPLSRLLMWTVCHLELTPEYGCEPHIISMDFSLVIALPMKQPHLTTQEHLWHHKQS